RAALEVSLRQAQKLESVGQLASGIAHEINTPIQFVNLNLTLLKKAFIQLTGVLDLYREALGPDPRLKAAEEDADLDYLCAELPKVLQDSLDGVQRVARIVRAMKEFTHPGARDPTLLDVNRLAGSAATIAANEWKYIANLDLDLEEGLPAVRGHAAELSQVLLNLIVNAAHAIGARGGMGTITVSTRSREGLVEIRVRDTGTGIPPEAQARVFEPFFTTKGVGKGTGQGLTICYQNIVNLHGGKIFFETEPGVGTTFIIQLPREG
ncbi:MAG: histidine kinase, partial [Holophaga sp.]|nr:histidine kinase [Holophaga sp.]